MSVKKEIQADNTICQEGTSGTNVFAFLCWFYRIHFIVCSNRWEWELWNLDSEDRDWLEKNTIVQKVDEYTFNEQPV